MITRSIGLRATGTVTPSPYLSRDTFTDSDGTLITNHTPDDGPAWSVVSIANIGDDLGDPDIQNNQLRFTGEPLTEGSTADGDAIIVDVGQADVTITVDWTPAVGVDNRNSVVMRYVDADNFWMFNVREPNADMNLFEKSSGTTTARDTATKTWTEGQTYALKVVLSGTSITCYVDDVEVLSYASATAHETETKHGVGRNLGADETRMDNWEVTS